uniref:Uncharacterized protein n=1 Tax=Oryza nivara TaxID=4536 RepID=A0A0E0IAG7_ORYNI
MWDPRSGPGLSAARLEVVFNLQPEREAARGRGWAQPGRREAGTRWPGNMRRGSGDLPPVATAQGGAGVSGTAWPKWPSSGAVWGWAIGEASDQIDGGMSIYGVRGFRFTHEMAKRSSGRACPRRARGQRNSGRTGTASGANRQN